MAPTEEFKSTIPSDTLAAQQIQERIIALLEFRQYSTRDVFSVRLALEEALVNAIKHGNRMDPAKSVRIKCQVDSTRIRIEIEDEGPGFKLEDVPDPTMDENLERPCGRGIMLMRSFMTSVEYSGAGNCVVMEKRRDTAAEKAAR